jgi:hypothetical protein
MEQSNRIQRSEVWEQIYKVVKTIPREDCDGMDAPDAPSVATELEELFLKLLPIQHVGDTVYDPDWEIIQTAPHGIQYKHKKTGETKWE